MSSKVIVSLNKAEKIIYTQIIGQLLYNLPASVVYIEGIMGIGKSQKIEQLKQQLQQYTNNHPDLEDGEWGFVDMRVAGFTGSDLQGIPSIEKDGKEAVLRWIKDVTLPRHTSKHPYGIIFLDEINQVEDNSVRSVLYQFLLDKKMNDYELPDGWFIVAAGNREEDGGVYNRLLAPIRDRIMIIEVEPNIKEWIDWARQTKVHPAVVSAVDLFQEDIFHTYSPDVEMEGDSDGTNYVFSTPRSLSFASDKIKLYEQLKNNEDITLEIEDLEVMLRGLLGNVVGRTLCTFYKQTGSIPIEQIKAAKWKDGKSSIIKEHKLQKLSTDNVVYLTNLAVYPQTENELIITRNIVYLLAYNSSYASSINLIINTLTPDQRLEINTHAIHNSNVSLIDLAQTIADETTKALK
ncbi:MAG: hypothetical protein ATN35_04750 [Epulopiscium sp. Nele67-Bin004]|nr:MAG: hypothetical protein ATN35_04750 [Epulopiscium sp. Nele67-Bin004]